MSQSLSQLYVHIVYHTKNNIPQIREQDEERLFAYMGAIIKDNQSIPIIINGVSDHVHILLILSKNVCMADIVEEIKKHSSRWIKTISPYYADFAWQGGYGGFSISQSIHKITKAYIARQKEHHKVVTFKDEYRGMLDEYEIEYDERYLWSD